MPLPTFGRIYLPIPGTKLIRRRQHRLLQEQLPNPHLQLIPPRQRTTFLMRRLDLLGSQIRSVQEGFCADIFQPGFEDFCVFE